MAPVYVGTAGWSLPKADQPRFPGEGTHLARYARVLAGAEINTSFYRPHRPATYAKWATSTPPAFRFAVKLPKAITHERRLRDADELLAAFLAEVEGLGERLGCLLVQLPPSLALDVASAGEFLAALRARHAGAVALEPRHASWFTPPSDALLERHVVARVAADPAPVSAAAEPGGVRDVVYRRLHGSPRMYYSDYDAAWLDALADRVRADAESSGAVWVIFDNTAAFHALPNALGLVERLGGG